MAKLFSYIVEHDVGIAPHVAGKYCTLVNCKFRKGKAGRRNIVELAEREDWIVGTGGASEESAGHGKLVYAMNVTDKLPLKEYSADIRFRNRADNQPHAPNCTNRFALISTHFYYFGRIAPSIPKRFNRYRLKHKPFPLEKRGPGFKNHFEQKFIDSFVSWLEGKYKGRRILGAPCVRRRDVLPKCRSIICQ